MGYLLIVVLWVALDQYTKYLVVSNLALGESVPLLENVFHLTYVNNYGAAFSLLQNKQIFLIVFTAAAMVLMLLYMIAQRKKVSGWILFALSLIVGGGIGNLIDRILNGYVVDFLDFRLWSPVFNVADIGVTCGCIALALAVFFAEPQRQKTRKKRTGHYVDRDGKRYE